MTFTHTVSLMEGDINCCEKSLPSLWNKRLHTCSFPLFLPLETLKGVPIFTCLSLPTAMCWAWKENGWFAILSPSLHYLAAGLGCSVFEPHFKESQRIYENLPNTCVSLRERAQEEESTPALPSHPCPPLSSTLLYSELSNKQNDVKKKNRGFYIRAHAF